MKAVTRMAFAAVAAFVSTGAIAQSSVRLLAGFPPGGGVDILARVFAEQLAEPMGRPVVVENQPGAGGLIAMQTVKAAPPDGNTLLVMVDSNLTVYPHTVIKPAYDPFRDFTPIAQIGASSLALVVGTNVPAKTLQEFITWAKANPKQSSYGSSGAGSVLQFYGSMIASELGIPFTHVPYRGVAPAIQDVVAGQVPAAVVPIGTALTQVKAGRARMLAQSGSKRAPSSPEVPTFTELGYPALEKPAWFGVIGPAGMSPELAARINGMFLAAMRKPVVRERMERLDLDIRELNNVEFAAVIRADNERWGQAVKASGWKPTE